MSDDSDDDCYGNVAQKLQSIKNSICKKNDIKAAKFLDDSMSIDVEDFSNRNIIPKPIENDVTYIGTTCDVSTNSLDSEEITLDDIIAKNSKRRLTRNSKRHSDINTDNILPERASRRKRTKKGVNNTDSLNNSVISDKDTTFNASDLSASTEVGNLTINSRTRSRGRGRGRRGRGRHSDTVANSIPSETSQINTSQVSNTSSTQTTTASSGLSESSNRGRGRGARRRNNRHHFWGSPQTNYSNIPQYSVGNTDEYPDQCDNQELFKSKPPQVIVVEEPELDDNEELSVKVYWQNLEYVKFNIRKYQKLTQIFEFFAKRENVSQDKLFFTYNDRILQASDTPDSIEYSIAKFIDGGIVHQSVTKLVQRNFEPTNGIVLKFQCQNVKTPFLIKIKPNDRLSVAMMKCAEHLEKSLDKLKFYFDGDLITGKSTPEDLDLEGGECIDVKVAS